MKEEIKLLNFIRSNRFILYVTIFTVVFLAPNTYYVFHSMSLFVSPYREIASAGVSMIVAASIMIYTFRKNYKMAKYYAYFEMSISAYYYIDMIGLGWALIPALSFTIMLPLSVRYYAQEIKMDVDYDELNDFLDKNPDQHPSDFIQKKM